MNEGQFIEAQVRYVAYLIGSRVIQLHQVAKNLDRHTRSLFTLTPDEPDRISQWMRDTGFAEDERGYFTQLPLLQLFREGKAPPDAISYFWPRDRGDDPGARFRMYALRNIGPHLQRLWDDLGREIQYLYYQDATGAVVTYPFVDARTAICPDFDWHQYYPYRTAGPEANPERSIRWTLPRNECSSHGLYVIITIPLYLDDRFVGLWSMDVPLRYLGRDYPPQRLAPEQIHFIMDNTGTLIFHDTMGPRTDPRARRNQWFHLRDLGGDFGRMDAGELIARQSGWLDVKDDRDTPLTFYFQTIPQTDWAACSSFPTQLMLDAIVADVTTGFRRITAGDFSYRIKPGGGPRTQTLIRECNRLAADLDRIQREHELSRRALQESEARYRTLVEGLPAITYIAALDAASTTLYVSPQVESIIGLTPEQYREDPDIWRKHLHPDDHDRVMKEVAASHESGRPLDVEYRMTTADGRTVWVHDKAQIVRDPVGRPLVLQGAMFDITRRKEDEEALRKNEGLLSTVLGAIQDSVSLWDLDFNLLYGNKAMADIVRQTGGNPEAGNLRDMIPTSERLDVWVRRFNTVLQTGKPMRSVRTAEEEPLAPRPYETYVAPVRDSQGRVFAIVSVYRDLSNHMREAEERRELANRLLEVQDAERRSVSDLLHDQMGQLLTLAKLDLDGFRTLNGTQRDRVKAISRRLDMALTAVRNMAAHLHPPHMDTMPLAEALELLVADFGRQSSIRTSFTRQGCVPNLAPAKKTCLYRILQESLTNVARHARASQVRILLRAESDEVTLEVRDNGKGLSDSSDTQRRGIGLISMRERVRQCGGRFEITSGKAGGCVVRAAIPVGEKAPGGWEEP